MYVKLPPGDLNLGPCPLYFTSTYTCTMVIAPKICGGGPINKDWMCKTMTIKYTEKTCYY